MNLVDGLIKQGWLKTPRIIEAFQKIKREDFLPEGSESLADVNQALAIGWGQTISQPLVVAFMLELLEPQPGEKILDIGSGSGWTSALLAYITSGGEPNENLTMKNEKLKGKVIALELIPELKEFGESNAAKYNFVDRGIVEFICADGARGYREVAPFDKILCSAEVKGDLPEEWKKQLKVGGRIVTPIGYSIWLFKKISSRRFHRKEYPGFTFVPLKSLA